MNKVKRIIKERTNWLRHSTWNAPGPVHLFINGALYPFGQVRKYEVEWMGDSWGIRVWLSGFEGSQVHYPGGIPWLSGFETEEKAWAYLHDRFNVIGP